MNALVKNPVVGGMHHFQKPFIPPGPHMMSQAAAQMISAQVITSAKMYSEANHVVSAPQMMSLASPTTQHPPRGNHGVRQKERRVCQVCGELGSGNFFGAMVCLPCKTFFIRCSSEEVSTFRCRRDGDCEITGPNRSRCKYCRYQQCVAVGMIRKERPEQIEACEGQQLCVVCGDVANGIHFGVMSCEGCKKFFRRGLQESDGYICKQDQRCVVNPRTRNECRYCRYQKCLHVGMSRLAIKMGRPRKNMREYPLGYMAENGNSMSSQSSPVGGSPPSSGFPENCQATYSRPLSTGSMGMQSIGMQSTGYHPYKSPYQTVFGRLNHIPIDVVSPEPKRLLSPLSTELSQSEETSYHARNVLNLTKKCSEDNIVDLARVKQESQDDDHYGQMPVSPQDWGEPSPRKYPESYGNKLSVGRTALSTYQSKVDQRGIRDDLSTDTGYSSPKEQREESMLRDNHRISPVVNSRPGSVQSLADDEVFISYVFPERYWLRPYIPNDNVTFGESNRKLVHDIIDLYLDFMTSFCQEDELSRMLKGRQDDVENLKTKDVWDLIRSRITKSTLDVLKFIKSLPGFSDIHPEDQYLICRLGVFQCSTLMAAINLYDPQTNNFTRNFYEHPIPLEELNDLRASLRDYARALHTLRLDTVESALLCCLIIMASDWPNLKSPGALEEVRWQLLGAFRAYVEVKYRRSSTRLEDLFSQVPRLRQLGMWHYRLSFEMFLDQKVT